MSIESGQQIYIENFLDRLDIIYEERILVYKSIRAQEKIYRTIDNILKFDKLLSPKKFMATHITLVRQNELNSLPFRVQTLFINIICEVLKSLVNGKLLSRLIFNSHVVGDPQAYLKFVKQAALPTFKDLINDLDKSLPNILEEVNRRGIYDEYNSKLYDLR